MDFISIIFIAIALAMDCFAVATSTGISVRKFYPWNTLKMSLAFGIFQGGMSLIGYLAGISFADAISKYDHWVAFGLLLIIGGKMVIESFSDKKDENEEVGMNVDIAKRFSWKTIILLAIATSIDALATGIIFVPFPDFIVKAIIVIGFASFLFALIGMLIGVTFGKRFNLNANLIGGLILIGIGTKILIEHLFLS